jgi:hypothetical protein
MVLMHMALGPQLLHEQYPIVHLAIELHHVDAARIDRRIEAIEIVECRVGGDESGVGGRTEDADVESIEEAVQADFQAFGLLLRLLAETI